MSRFSIGVFIRLFCLGSLLLAVGVGCTSSSESAHKDTLTADVGKYPPPPSGMGEKPRVGVPPFKVQGQSGFSGKDVDDLAADQMTTLLDQTERFDMIERAQLTKLLDEQNLEGIVKAGELARPGQVRGVDYLLIGKVTNLRVKKENKSTSFGLAQVGNLFGGADVKKKDIMLTTECGVDIRLVDPTSGKLLVSNFSEFKRVDTAGAMGVDILGASAEADADISVSEDDKGKILRLALDDAIKKCLPKIDSYLVSRPAKPMSDAPMPSSPAPKAVDTGAAGTVAAKHFCPQCGQEVAAGVKFCPHCGAKMGG